MHEAFYVDIILNHTAVWETSNNAVYVYIYAVYIYAVYMYIHIYATCIYIYMHTCIHMCD